MLNRVIARVADRVWPFGEAAAPVSLLAVAAAAMLVTLLLRTVHDVDIFWQLKLGELTLAGGLPAREPFLAGREDEPLAAVAWLGQAVFAAVRQVGGWPLLRLFDALVWFGGFAAVAGQVNRKAPNAVPAAAALWVGWFAAVPFASVRPQSFAILCFGLFVVLVRARLAARIAVPLGAMLLVLWQNLHPSAGVAAAYALAYAAGEWFVCFRRGGTRPTFASIMLVPVAAAATLATPEGLNVYAISAANADRCEYLIITEWRPMWNHGLEVGRNHAWPMLILAAAIIIVRGRRAKVADLLPLAGLTLMTLGMFRFVVFWGVAVIPVLAACFAETTPPPAATRPHPRRKWLGGGLVVLAAAVPIAVSPYRFENYLPFAAAAELEKAGVTGTVYSNYYAAGILNDTGHPRRRVTHDGRYYLFTRADLAAYEAAARGEVPVAELVAKYHPTAFFLRPRDDDGLIARLHADPAWRLLCEDETAVVFVAR